MGRLLDSIDNPTQLHGMTHAQLKQLAQEIRGELLSVVSHTGGHLAPNLGVVELTIALHSSLNSGKDKIVWDVGHQSYVHKLLTGRRDEFKTLRQLGGLSGFPKRAESIHDPFDTGHSSTSISAALGLACARDLQGDDYHVVAVIGDGSMTGGMAFEALNHAGHLGTRLIVILNDNEMSIAHNVGALSKYLNRLRMDPTLQRVKEDVEGLLSRIPAIGGRVVKTVGRVKDSLKYLLVPGMLFEELGFIYLGPIDGHDIGQMRRALHDAKHRGGPVLIHVVTVKGKGYGPAEKNPERFHGTGPFEVSTGVELSAANTQHTYTDVFRKTIVKLGEQNSKIVAITAAMPDGTGLSDFAVKFPKRFFDVGIAEQHGVTLAGGLAVQGLIPVVAIYSSFIQRAYDQILHDICLQNLHVIFVLDRAGLVGPDGPTHHGVYDFAFLRHLPNITVMAPKDGKEFELMLSKAITMDGPVAIRIPKSSVPSDIVDYNCRMDLKMPTTDNETIYDPISAEPYIQGKITSVDFDNSLNEASILPIGEPECLKVGGDVVILAIGSMVATAVNACKLLEAKGYKATLINARFVKPINRDYIKRISNACGILVTIEEHVLDGGFGSAVLESLTGSVNSSSGIGNIEIVRIGLPDTPIEHGPRSILLERYGLSPEKICETIEAVLIKRHKTKAVPLELIAH